MVSKRVVLADVPPERKPERGYIRMFPRNENRNEGTFGCSPGTKTGTRVRSDVPPERKPERGYVRQNHPFTKPPFYLRVNRIRPVSKISDFGTMFRNASCSQAPECELASSSPLCEEKRQFCRQLLAFASQAFASLAIQIRFRLARVKPLSL